MGIHNFLAAWNTDFMLIIFLRSSIIFLVLLLVMRLMGKRQIGEMQPFELVITLLIAEVAGTPMADISIPLLYGVVSVLALFILHQVLSLLGLTGFFVKTVISGKPSLIIGKEGINYKELRKNDLDVSDVMEALRGQGYFSLADVSYAILESTGTFSVLPAATRPEKPALSMLLIGNGKLCRKNLTLLGIDENFVQKTARAQGVKSVKDVLAFTIDGNGNCYFQPKNGVKSTFSVQLEAK
ncbi:MAG: DUF421 domain-containing protein [Clostridia bacterium]|nr:DUF421 domain-containing protein [Clostridia bacterium]